MYILFIFDSLNNFIRIRLKLNPDMAKRKPKKPIEKVEEKPVVSNGIKKEFYIKIAVEILSVVFAVLLALGVDEWRENKKNEALALQAEMNLKDEIALNIERLGEMISENNERVIQIDSLIKWYKSRPKMKGIELPSMTFSLLSTAAWQSVKTTKAINHIKFEMVLFYSSFYDLFDIHKKKVDGYLFDKEIRIEMWNSKDAVLELMKRRKIYENFNSTAKQIKSFYEENKSNLKGEE